MVNKKEKTFVLFMVCNDRKELVAGCDSLTTFGDVEFNYREDKIYHIGRFLFGASGDSNGIIEILRLLEDDIPDDIIEARDKIDKFIKEKSLEVYYVLGGDDHGKISLFSNQDEQKLPEPYWHRLSQKEEVVDYELTEIYNPKISLNKGIYYTISLLNKMEIILGVKRPFFIHYIKNENCTFQKPKRLDKEVLNEFQKLVDKRKENINSLEVFLESSAESIKII